LAPILTVPSGPFISILPASRIRRDRGGFALIVGYYQRLLDGSSFMVTVLPWSSVTVMVLFSESNPHGGDLAGLLSRTTMVPVESSFDTVSRSGFALPSS